MSENCESEQAVRVPDREPVALSIKATAEGSFEVQLILEAAGVWDHVVDLFNSDAASALANLMGIVGGGWGLFAVAKVIGRRLIKRHEEVEPGQIKLTLDDGDTVEIPAEVFDLYRNVQVRKKARQVVAPLDRAGVDRLDFRTEEQITVSIEEADVSAFELQDVEIPLLERESEMVLAIASITFIEGNKWRFSDGEQTFYATIEDEAFLRRVESGLESFRNGDFLECRIRTVQSQRGDALQTERYITEVIRHIPREIQLPLDDGSDDASQRPG